jgi:4-hydroxy-2-oxoheptanedioate aldolase
MRPNRIKTLWKGSSTIVNGWLTIPGAWTAELMAKAGFDAVTIDMQHGLADYETALTMLVAISTTDTVPLVRVPWNDPAILMRVLDAGAYGVICPMINSRREAEAFVNACRYAPQGYRSVGPVRATVYAGDDYVSQANTTIQTLAMIETAQAMENLEEIAATPGLDGFYIGPADLSLSLGLPRMGDFTQPELLAACDRVLAAAQRHALLPGIHAGSPENAKMLSERGFRLVTPANDTVLLKNALTNALAQTRRGLGQVAGEENGGQKFY